MCSQLLELECPAVRTSTCFTVRALGSLTCRPVMVWYSLPVSTWPGRVRCSTCRPGELRGCRREHGSYWGRRDTVPLNVQGQLKGVDQEVRLLLIYETGQRPENQITTLVHTVRAPREKRREGRGEERKEKKLD